MPEPNVHLSSPVGRCGRCERVTDQLPCPLCTLGEIVAVDGYGTPLLTQAQMYQLAADALAAGSHPDA